MKKLLSKLTLLALIIILLGASFSWAQTKQDKELFLSKLLLQTLDYWHYRPVDVNDQLSQNTFTLFIQDLDYNKKYFLKSDIERLRQFENKIDDQLNEGSTEFMELAYNLLEKRIQDIQGFYPELLSEPFNFTIDEYLETKPEKINYCTDKNELKELWRKLLKYQTLTVYLEMLQTPEYKNKADILAKEIDPKLEAEARERVAKNIKSSLLRMLQQPRTEQFELYLNAVMTNFDPHTNYFPPERKEDFDINMSGKLEGIGALLREDGEFIKVEQIIPGSPSARQKVLKEGDLILKVGEGNNEPIDVSNMRINAVVKLIRGKKGTEVRLTVKKPDGQIQVIPIIRDVVIIEDSYAKSAVLFNTKNGEKTGYIALPSFYHDFNAKNEARSSATDVRNELEKLKKDNVSGVILDLRNNVGGALDDAVKMAGLFIKSGPIVQVKDKNGKISVLKDTDSKVVYDGPLVILINSGSASASEILAAALQDYERAIIVGGTTSYGKGTVQAMVDMDQLVSGKYNEFKPLGSIKLTTQKYYRITGGSVQFKGVTADIPLPDTTSYLEIGEKYQQHAMPWDTIATASYQKWGQNRNKLINLKQKSSQRVKANTAFQIVNSTIEKFKKNKEDTRQSLQLNKIWQDQKNGMNRSEQLRNAQKKDSTFKAKPVTPEDQNKLKTWLGELSKDIYLDETLRILNDSK